ncbi:MAG: hypothetical protein GY946_04970 [bacterium]|nr:hypothetical protein [bacterium]
MAGARARNLFGPRPTDTLTPQLIAQGGQSIAAGILGGVEGVVRGVETGRARKDAKERLEAQLAESKAARAQSAELRREDIAARFELDRRRGERADKVDDKRIAATLARDEVKNRADTLRNEASDLREEGDKLRQKMELRQRLNDAGAQVPQELEQQIQVGQKKAPGLAQKLKLLSRRLGFSDGSDESVVATLDAMRQDPREIGGELAQTRERGRQLQEISKAATKAGSTAERRAANDALLVNSKKEGSLLQRLRQGVADVDNIAKQRAAVRLREEQAQALATELGALGLDETNVASLASQVANGGMSPAAAKELGGKHIAAQKKEIADTQARADEEAERARSVELFNERAADATEISDKEKKRTRAELASGEITYAQAMENLEPEKVKVGKQALPESASGELNAWLEASGSFGLNAKTPKKLSDEHMALGLGHAKYSIEWAREIIARKWEVNKNTPRPDKIALARRLEKLSGLRDTDTDQPLTAYRERLAEALWLSN